jgi:hypothetical protein
LAIIIVEYSFNSHQNDSYLIKLSGINRGLIQGVKDFAEKE